MMRARNWREVLIAVSRAGPAGVIRMASHATPRPRYPNPSPTTCSGDLVLIVLPSEAWPVPTPPRSARATVPALRANFDNCYPSAPAPRQPKSAAVASGWPASPIERVPELLHVLWLQFLAPAHDAQDLLALDLALAFAGGRRLRLLACCLAVEELGH